MGDDIQNNIDRTIGFCNFDLSPLTDLADVVPHLASSCPACTISDLSQYLGQIIARVEASLASLRDSKADIDAKPAGDRVLVACIDRLPGSFLFEPGECGSSLGWLLKLVLDEYKSGNTGVIDRYIYAADRLTEVYASRPGNDIENPYSTLSETFDAYCSAAEGYVKGAAPALCSYSEFVMTGENARAN